MLWPSTPPIEQALCYAHLSRIRRSINKETKNHLSEPFLILRRALSIFPNSEAVWQEVEQACQAVDGSTATFLSAYEDAVSWIPEQYLGHLQLGNAYFGLSRFSEALRHYEAALRNFQTSARRSSSLVEGGSTERGVLGTVSLSTAIALLGNVAQALRAVQRHAEALPYLQSAFRCLVAARGQDGVMFETTCASLPINVFPPCPPDVLSGAEAWITLSLDALQRELLAWRYLEQGEVFFRHWTRLHLPQQPQLVESVVMSPDVLSSLHPSTILMMPTLPLHVYRTVEQLVCSGQDDVLAYWAWHRRGHLERNRERVDTGRVLRVAYISSDFRDHPTYRLLGHLITNHNSSRIFTLVLAVNRNDNGREYAHLMQAADRFTDMSGVDSSDAVAAEVADEAVDILVDVTVHSGWGLLSNAGENLLVASSRRPANIVVNYLAYPSSSGCKGYHYTVVDSMSVPPEVARESFVESLVYVPGSYQANDMPLETLPCLWGRGARGMQACRGRLLDEPPGLGKGKGRAENISSLLRHDRILLCSFNGQFKYEPQSFSGKHVAHCIEKTYARRTPLPSSMITIFLRHILSLLLLLVLLRQFG